MDFELFEQLASCGDQFHRGLQFINGFVVIDPVSNILGSMAHEKINTLPVPTG